MFRVEKRITPRSVAKERNEALGSSVARETLEVMGRNEVKRIRQNIGRLFRVRSGRLSRSPSYRIAEDRGELVLGVFIGQELNRRERPYYWYFLEFGTQSIRARRFYYPSEAQKRTAAQVGLRAVSRG